MSPSRRADDVTAVAVEVVVVVNDAAGVVYVTSDCQQWLIHLESIESNFSIAKTGSSDLVRCGRFTTEGCVILLGYELVRTRQVLLMLQREETWRLSANIGFHWWPFVKTCICRWPSVTKSNLFVCRVV